MQILRPSYCYVTYIYTCAVILIILPILVYCCLLLSSVFIDPRVDCTMQSTEHKTRHIDTVAVCSQPSDRGRLNTGQDIFILYIDT